MIKKLRRAATAAALLLAPLAAPAPAHAHDRALETSTLPMAASVHLLPLAAEVRDGYQRTSFKHWNAGQNPTDGCNTRAEVLLAEAVERPQVLPGCKLSGGRWWSYYDAKWLTSASALDVDHMVPLAEAWDSGASQWTAQRREAYANDLAVHPSLVAVSAASNRSKADQDPAQWLPPAVEVTCRYTSEWIATKLRWGLTADAAELEALTQLAEACPSTTVTYQPAA
ncbi:MULTISPECIES: HNH endonuclease family protein [unclassified Streptomyces]|uniref:HNH endonuclease family protein n=1 Tax=unclassified Streptomyces TaxID=2593676 RepID=UPI0023672ABA|nr:MULTISPECIES: HNH endonuclease family protein [unclassified Streptomyces]MDF3142942.1 HNH endonuclease family protein [Streptomyces sp. T21Q-yed]WDF40015.1 HNH endonuclease family protein [Streptomyces sp. T12]